MGERYWRNKYYESRDTTRWLINMLVGVGIVIMALVGALVLALAR